jgi:Thermolysin metallopeptidase, alpha-helical domain
MIYGQRMVNGALRSYALASDVVAHEITHGLTDRTARLEYQRESGALNESYSDIFGVIISNRNQPNIDAWDWEMGEDLNATGIPLRDLSDPPRRGQPDHMRDFPDWIPARSPPKTTTMAECTATAASTTRPPSTSSPHGMEPAERGCSARGRRRRCSTSP